MAWRGFLPRAGLFAVILALLPLPVAAEHGTAQAKTSNISVSMERIVSRDIGRAPVASSRRPARQAQAAGNASGFFKSKPGIIALVVMAAGTGYALYSASHDRIHSPGKQ
jgi:hypothetical protein